MASSWKAQYPGILKPGGLREVALLSWDGKSAGKARVEWLGVVGPGAAFEGQHHGEIREIDPGEIGGAGVDDQVFEILPTASADSRSTLLTSDLVPRSADDPRMLLTAPRMASDDAPTLRAASPSGLAQFDDTRMFHPAPGSAGAMAARAVQVVGYTGFASMGIGGLVALVGAARGTGSKTGLKIAGAGFAGFLTAVVTNRWVVKVPGY
jgi:hypothetical protein